MKIGILGNVWESGDAIYVLISILYAYYTLYQRCVGKVGIVSAEDWHTLSK
jgi:hypothetical protein